MIKNWESIDTALNYDIDLNNFREMLSKSERLNELFSNYIEYIHNEGTVKSIPNSAKVFSFFILLGKIFEDVHYFYGQKKSTCSQSMLYIANSGDAKSKLYETLISFYAYVRNADDKIQFDDLSKIKNFSSRDFTFVTNSPTLKQITGGNITKRAYNKQKQQYEEKSIWTPGVLEKNKFCVFEEFSQILAGATGESHSILMQLNSAMDKPGYVDAQGLSNYNDAGKQLKTEVNASVLMASTFYHQFYKINLLNSGFYRRPLFVCNLQYDRPKNERRHKYLNKLPIISSKDDVYFDILKGFLDEFKKEFNKIKDNMHSCINYNGMLFHQKYGIDIFDEFEYFITHSGLNETQRYFLNTIRDNNHIHMCGIACVCAAIDNRKMCNENDYKIAYEVCRSSFIGALKFIINQGNYKVDLTVQPLINPKEIKIVRGIIEKHRSLNHPNDITIKVMPMTELLNILYEMKKNGDWMYGKNTTSNKINEMILGDHVKSTEHHDNLLLQYNRKYVYL